MKNFQKRKGVYCHAGFIQKRGEIYRLLYRLLPRGKIRACAHCALCHRTGHCGCGAEAGGAAFLENTPSQPESMLRDHDLRRPVRGSRGHLPCHMLSGKRSHVILPGDSQSSGQNQAMGCRRVKWRGERRHMGKIYRLCRLGRELVHGLFHRKLPSVSPLRAEPFHKADHRTALTSDSGGIHAACRPLRLR